MAGTDIFISYKRERRKAAEHLAAALTHHGYSVWFDYQMIKGADFGVQIERRIHEARALVVLWCSLSVGSRWVVEEAGLGYELGKLIPVKIERCELPMGFRRQDYTDLSSWDGSPRSYLLDTLIAALEQRIGRPAQVNHKGLREYEATWRRFGAPSLKAFALGKPVREVEGDRKMARAGITSRPAAATPLNRSNERPKAAPEERKRQAKVASELASRPAATSVRNVGAPPSSATGLQNLPGDPFRSARAPIYVICSPNRQVGKTMLARLLAEHHAADGRPFAAYDLSDEVPGLADFLSHDVSLANIREMRGQVEFFDGLIESDNVPKIIDVSHREFANFFGIVDKIGLFEEAQRRGIEPVILFLVDRSQVAADAYGLLRRRFAGMSLLPVRNLLVSNGVPYGASFPHASKLVVSIEIAVLGPAARSFAERERFSFANLSRPVRPYSEISPRTRAELEGWFQRARFQFREMELSLIHQQILSVQ
jgi:hypothetical protein